MPVFLLPVGRYARGHPPQQMAGQVGHPHPGRDEQAGVVGKSAQMATALFGSPADPAVPPGHFPGGRAEQQTGQYVAVPVASQVLQVLPHTVAMPQIMITLEQEPEQRGVGSALGQRLQLHRLPVVERALDEALVMVERDGLAIAQAIDRGAPPWWQLNLALGLQLQKQAASGHVL